MAATSTRQNENVQARLHGHLSSVCSISSRPRAEAYVQQFMRWLPDREWNCRRQQDEEKRKREQAQVLGKGGARSRLSFKISAT